MLHTEFRDGNVPAGYEQLRVLKRALSLLPEGVKTVRLRSDTAGYQHDLITYCNDEKKHPRFGRIEFAIGCDVTPEFKKAVHETKEWHPLSIKMGVSPENMRRSALSPIRVPQPKRQNPTAI